jgi:rhodanese-related sulfurtransferase
MTLHRELGFEAARALIGRPEVLLVDVREALERERDGAIPGAVHAPFTSLASQLCVSGPLHHAALSGRRLLFYCTGGQRSARAVQAATAAGFGDACHIDGGIRAWRDEGGPIEPVEPVPVS